MKTEYVNDVLQKPEIVSRLQELNTQESIAKNPQSAESLKKSAAQRANSIRKDLLQRAEASLIYQYLKATGNADADAFRTIWQATAQKVDVWRQLSFSNNQRSFFDPWFQPVMPNLETFPAGCFSIQFPFQLTRPYLSKDDREFSILDNPILREKNFLFPMIRSTSWKGTLKNTFWQLGYTETDPIILRMFGSHREEEENFRAGRLQCYTSFFTYSGLEVINPHDRGTKIGKNPILFETVPSGAESTFSIFYFPFDRIGETESNTSQETIFDLILLTRNIQTMFNIYGFGAKTSSGFGLASSRLPRGNEGRLSIKLHLGKNNQPVIDLNFDNLDLMIKKADALGRKLLREEQLP